MSDSSFAAATRHRKPYSTAGRPPSLDVIDDGWAADILSDDEIDVKQQEAAIAPLLDEGEDVDAVVVSTGHSGSAAGAAERRRREEGRWNDLGLDHFDNGGNVGSSNGSGQRPDQNTGNSGQQS